MNEQKEQGIFEYIRRRQGGKVRKVGIILAKVVDNTIKIGFSKCNLKMGDVFDPDMGLEIAHKRIDGFDAMPPVPACIRKQVRAMGGRSIRYFRDVSKVELPA